MHNQDIWHHLFFSLLRNYQDKSLMLLVILFLLRNQYIQLQRLLPKCLHHMEGM
jgi:hypothetical protein